ncbi:unnamed protein product [Rhodiola kirilowii]
MRPSCNFCSALRQVEQAAINPAQVSDFHQSMPPFLLCFQFCLSTSVRSI